MEGIFGTQGTYWNKTWGRFRVFVTDDENTVEILLDGGERVLLSPDEPEEFAANVRAVLSLR